MFGKNDFGYFNGTVQQVTFREKLHTSSRDGGGFLFRGTGFVAAPSVSVHAQTIQDFWLSGAQGERNFKIWGDELAMREGHRVTALWFRGRLVAYANHATNRFLLLDDAVSVLAGSKFQTTLLNTWVPVLSLVVGFSLAGMVNATPDFSRATKNMWGLIAFCRRWGWSSLLSVASRTAFIAACCMPCAAAASKEP